jgi:hypothetical protein
MERLMGKMAKRMKKIKWISGMKGGPENLGNLLMKLRYEGGMLCNRSLLKVTKLERDIRREVNLHLR